MNVLELAQEILAEIESGKLDPTTIVVRPFCMCDEEFGWVEAAHLGTVVRIFQTNGTNLEQRFYNKGNVEPSTESETTLKLG